MDHIKDYNVKDGRLLVRDVCACGAKGKGITVNMFVCSKNRCKECELFFNKIKKGLEDE